MTDKQDGAKCRRTLKDGSYKLVDGVGYFPLVQVGERGDGTAIYFREYLSLAGAARAERNAIIENDGSYESEVHIQELAEKRLDAVSALDGGGS